MSRNPYCYFGGLSTLLTAVLIGVSSPALSESLPEEIARALGTNPEVLSQNYQVSAAIERVGTAKAGNYPTLDLRLSGGYENSENPATRARTGGDEDLTRTESSLTLKQNLFNGFATSSSIDSAKSGTVIETQGLEDVSERLALRVVRAYLDVLNFEEQVSLAENNVKNHQSLLDLVQKRVKQQVGSRSEANQAQARLRAAEASLFRAKGNLADAEAAYRNLLETLPSKLHTPSVPRDLAPKNREESLNLALRNRAILKQAMERVEKAKAEVKRLTAPYYPSIDLELSAENDEDLDGTEGRNESYQALVVMNYNLYAGGADQHRRAEAKYLLRQARTNVERVKRNLTEEVMTGYNAWDISRSRLDAFEAQVFENQEVRKAYFQQYKIGKRTLLDLLDAENELFVSRSNRTTEAYQENYSVYRILQSQGRLLNALGVALPPSATL